MTKKVKVLLSAVAVQSGTLCVCFSQALILITCFFVLFFCLLLFVSHVREKSERAVQKEIQKRFRHAELLLTFNRRHQGSQSEDDGLSEHESAEEEEMEIGERTSEDEDDNNLDNVEAGDAHEDVGCRNHEETSDSDQPSDSDGDRNHDSGEGENLSEGDNNGENENAGGCNDVPREDRRIADPEQYVRQQLLEWTLAGGVSMSKVDDLLKRLKLVHTS